MENVIDFCEKAFPRFQFLHMDVNSPYYNPDGSMHPDEMVLPVEPASFDVTVLFSVFTHLLPSTFMRMASEVERVLKPNGRCLATFFVLDNLTDRSVFSLNHQVEEYCRVESEESPESVVGYTTDFINDTFAKSGFRLKTFYPGSWTGQPGLGLQDQILFIKE